jgi:L-fuconolactonase
MAGRDYAVAASWPRADAHIHLVPPHGCSWASDRTNSGVTYDEPIMYDALTKTHGIEGVLVASVDSANDEFIAAVAHDHEWCRPAAFFTPPTLSVAALEALDIKYTTGTFTGIAMYLGAADNDALQAVDPAVWRWLDQRRWLVSCNDSGEGWGGWVAVLTQCPTLRLIASHMGLPGAAPPSERESPATIEECEARLGEHLLALASFPGPRVKLSAFYANAEPSHDFPHRQAFGYVQALLKHFGAARLCWGSDFSPCLFHVSFQQTIDVFARMDDFLTEDDCRLIEGANLLQLLEDARTAAAGAGGGGGGGGGAGL